jgi:Xaa-Pro aminopeptidase
VSTGKQTTGSKFYHRIPKIQSKLGPKEVLVLFAADHKIRNHDVEYKFRQDSDFYYVTGIPEENTILLLKKKEAYLFCLPKDKDQEIWTGIRYGKEYYKSALPITDAWDLGEWNMRFPELILGEETLFYFYGQNPDRDREIFGSLHKINSRSRDGRYAPETVKLPTFLHELRLHKSDDEVRRIRESARITGLGHLRLLQETKPGMYEYELESILESTYLRSGAWGGGYGHIVASGQNACILHYVRNREILKEGELVLVDSGAEKDGYTADVTRCFPVGREFSEPQKIIYDLVLAAQKNAIQLCSAGREFYEIQDKTVRFFLECLKDMKFLKGSLEELEEKGAIRRFYMHKIGHYLGMDVHDCGKYFIQGKRRKLESGMVVTIEPGLYIAPDDETVPEEFRGIGIRIEDDILIQGKRPVNLTEFIPKEIEEIEAIRKESLRK